MRVEESNQGSLEGAPEERRNFVEPRRKARRYQLEILDKALEENTIIFLETGCGKTLISVLWIETLSHLIRKPSQKIAVFLVPNVALVEQVRAVHSSFCTSKPRSHLKHFRSIAYMYGRCQYLLEKIAAHIKLQLEIPQKFQRLIRIFVNIDQQAKEIEDHTDLKIGKFWGSMGEGSSWDHAWWQAQIVKYEVFVMTPQILFNNLHHCFVKMEMIELLVFDECHRAQKRHPYANIMRDFYHGKKYSLPKIFGLTASPVNGKAGGGGGPQKIDSEIHKLESMLDAKLYTVQDRTELESTLPNPSQYIRKYQPSYALEHVKYLSGLLRELRTKYVNSSDIAAYDSESVRTSLDMKMEKKEMDAVSKVYHKLDWCIHELGLWCTIEAAEILLNKEGLRQEEETGPRGLKEAFLRDALLMLKTADWTDQSATEVAQGDDRYDIDETLLSPRLRCLVEVIKENREKYTKGIVFVDRVVATGAMSSILNRLKCLPFIKSLPLVGSQSMSQKSQQQAIDKFRSNEVNLLVATEIAEEGLDIQSCFMVIRFDGVPKTTRSFIQSRGRARQKGSTFIVLLESGNQDQLNDVIQLKEKEKLMWEFTENRGDMPIVLQEPEMYEVELFEVESTGARVTTDYSVPLLYRYCLRLPGDEFYQPVPIFSYFQKPGGIVCEIKLPIAAPFQKITGHPAHTEKMARRAAALAACKRLHELGALTDHLLPASEVEETYVNEDDDRQNLPTDPMAQMELHSIIVPEGFRGGWATACAIVSLFAFSLHIVAEPKDREYADFALFLEADLDDHLKSSVTELYLTKGRTVKIELISHGQLEFDMDQLRDAKRFQERIFSITLDPKAEQDPEHLSLPTLPYWDPACLYLTLPLLPFTSNPISVDWKSVRTLLTEVVPGSPPFIQSKYHISGHESVSNPCACFRMANGNVPLEAAINSLVETTHNGKQYIIENVFWDMDCQSPFENNPSSVAKTLPHIHNSSQYRNYVNYYKKRYKLDILHPKQLLLKAKPLMKMHNLLVKRPKDKETGDSLSSSQTELETHLFVRKRDMGMNWSSGSTAKAETFVELPPELCCIKVLGFSSQIVNTLSLIPSFMHRVEYSLLATQLHNQLKKAFSEAAKVSPSTILQALTTAKCLESLSLERFELFGDSFLKFAVSKRLFLVYDKLLEGALTKMRQSVICNTALHRRGVAHKLTRYIHDEHFNPVQWSAPGRPRGVHCDATNQDSIHPLQHAADGSNPNQVKCSERHRWLQKKAVADVVEAFIGAHLVDGGPQAALAFLEWVGISVHFDRKLIAQASTHCAGDIRFVQGKDLNELEGILGYTFHNKSILVEALTHPSYQVPFGSCYQRLEFLGDAVLDYLITRHLYDTFKNIDPGELTDLRSATVCNECFSRVAVRHHLQKFLLHENANLAEQVKKFVLFIENVSLGKAHFYGWECDKGPKVLGDLVESLAGAVLVDSGFDTDKVWSIFEPLLQPIVTPETLHLHPVRELVELCNKQKFKCECISTSKGTLRIVNYTVHTGKETIVAQAEKADKKSAKRRAAYEMLGKLKNMGWQHWYRALTTSLISQGKLEPLGEVTEVRKQGYTVDEPESSGSTPISICETSDEVHTLSSMCEGVSFTSGKENFRVPGNHADASQTVADKLKEKILHNELEVQSPTILNREAPSDEGRKPPQTLLEILEERRKFEASRFSVQSESCCPQLSDSAEAIDRNPASMTAQEMQLLSRSLATLDMSETSSRASSDSLECLTSWNIPESGGEEGEDLKPDDWSGVAAPTDVRLLTETFQLDEDVPKEIQVDESSQNLISQGISRRLPGRHYEATFCKPSTYELAKGEIFTREATFLKRQADSLTSNKPLDSNRFEVPVSGDTEIDSLHVSSDVQSLIDALVRQPPVHQPSNVGAGLAAAPKENFKEEVHHGTALRPDAVQGFFNPGDSLPSSTCKENPSGWGLNANSSDENVGRPREDLHNLCAKHKWAMPSYKPCPDYPQGPPHAPRFAFLVKLSCSLMNNGHINDYNVECEGEPMNNKSRAMDSAASCAMVWLQDNFKSGWTFAQGI